MRIVSALAVVVVASGLLAAPAVADPQVSVEVGYGGQVLTGRPFPVRVVIDADRLIRGTLTIEVPIPESSAVSAYGTPVEVAGGAKKAFIAVLPSAVEVQSTSVSVHLRAGSIDITRSANIDERVDVELVGVLPELFSRTSPPATANLSVDAGTASIVELDALVLSSPGALEPLDVIATDERAWQDLDAAGRQNVATWVADGGELLVEAPVGTVLDGLPAPWGAGPSGRAAAEDGEVVVTGAQGRPWWTALAPTSTRSASQDAQLNPFGFGPTVPAASAVASDAGLRTAGLRWLTWYLATYVIIVGPAAYLVLKRLRRPGLLWVVVPGLAVMFTGSAWVAGRGLHGSSAAAHTTVVSQTAVGARAVTWLGRVSQKGGTASTPLPDGWSPGAVGGFFGDGSVVIAPSIVDGAQGRVVEQHLAAGGFGVVKLVGPMALTGGLEITARSNADGVVTGEVKNTTSVTLVDVGVLAGSGGVAVGELAPGQQQSFTITGADALAVLATKFGGSGVSAMTAVWPSADPNQMFNGGGVIDGGGALNAAALSELAQLKGSNYWRPGLVRAVGWTRDLHPPLLGGAVAGRTAIVSQAGILSDGPPSDMAIARSVLRAPGIFGGQASPSAVYSFTLPDGFTGPTELRASMTAASLEVWIDGAWKSVLSGLVARPTAAGSVSTTPPTTDLVPLPAPPQIVSKGGVITAVAIAGGGFAGGGLSDTSLGAVRVPSGAVVNGRIYVRIGGQASPVDLASVSMSGIVS